MRGRLVHGLQAAANWHRLVLKGSPTYRRICHTLAIYVSTGYWDLRPPQDDMPY